MTRTVSVAVQAVAFLVPRSETPMSKGYQKPNKEVRKPKSVKTKPPASQASQFAVRAGLSAGSKTAGGGKKAK
jgi:hypothetical protein